MKLKTLLLPTVMLTLAPFAIGKPGPEITGLWRGDKMGVPWATVKVIHAQGGQLSGTTVFYILDRAETEQPKVQGKQEIALFDPKMAGNVLSFKGKNQQGAVTMNPFSGEALELKMIVRNETDATLKSEDRDSLSVKMVKQK